MILIFILITEALRENDCVSIYGWKGYCRPSWDCTSLSNLVARGYQPEPCDTGAHSVCCPTPSKQPTQVTFSKPLVLSYEYFVGNLHESPDT